MIDSNLPIFISVADLGSFSRAGCQLKKSPQTIFRQISSFENKIGIKLFDRSPAGMKLTKPGVPSIRTQGFFSPSLKKP